jgi:hypothetical protein
MNERIQELVLKARGQATSDTKDGGNCFDVDLFHKKFAELIIQECKKAIDPTGDLTSMAEAGWREECMKMIDQHFGVEE